MSGHSFRAARATDIALAARIPLEIHSRGNDAVGQREGVNAYMRGAEVVMNQRYRYHGQDGASVVLAVGRFSDATPLPSTTPTWLIEAAGMSMYRREFTQAASELLTRAVERLELSGRERETTKLISRAIAGLQESHAILPEHVAEALSYRRPRSL